MMKSDVLEKFLGADIKGSKRNPQAVLLEDCWKRTVAVGARSEESGKTTTEFVELGVVEDCMDQFEKYNHIILQLRRHDDRITDKLLSAILDGKEIKSYLIIFPSLSSQFGVLSKLNAVASKTGSPSTIQVFFNDDSSHVDGRVIENLKPALWIGKLPADGSSIRRCYGSLTELQDFLRTVMFPNSKVLYVSDGSSFQQLHGSLEGHQVTYLGPKSLLMRLKNTIKRENNPLGSRVFSSIEVSEQNQGSSTSPVKYNPQHNKKGTEVVSPFDENIAADKTDESMENLDESEVVMSSPEKY